MNRVSHNKKVLGRGLGNLLNESNQREKKENGIIEIDISLIKTNPTNPRKKFDNQLIIELSETIQSVGLLHPILVKEENKNSYTVISGERRLRALQYLNFKKIPCIIKKISEREKLEISLIENIQRAELDPIEEAHVYQQLMQEYKFTQEQVAKRVGKPRSSVANKMRILTLPEHIKVLVISGQISEGQARSLVSLNNRKIQDTLVKEIIQKKYNARQVEDLVKKYKKKILLKVPLNSSKQDSNIVQLQNKIEENLKTRVKIKYNYKKSTGSICIDYFNLDHLDEIIQKIIK